MWFTKCFSSYPCSQVNLRQNKIGADGAKAIASALAVNASLTLIGEGGLDLRYNSMDEEGWAAIIEGVCSSSTSKITSIDASCKGIGPAGAKRIAEALQKSVNAPLTTVNSHSCLHEKP